MCEPAHLQEQPHADESFYSAMALVARPPRAKCPMVPHSDSRGLPRGFAARPARHRAQQFSGKVGHRCRTRANCAEPMLAIVRYHRAPR